MKGRKFFLSFLLTAAFCVFFCFANSTDEYAEKTGLNCEYCHIDSSGGGDLTDAGENYLAEISEESGKFQPKKLPSKRSRLSKYFRFIAGFLHIFTAIFWFGTILYVHLILKPAYAAHGLPRGEIRVGLVSMAVLGVTGLILTCYRITSLSILLNTRFGILLSVKVFLFLLMVSTVLYVVTVLGPKLKQGGQKTHREEEGMLTEESLKAYDGIQNQEGYFAFQKKIYDVTHSQLWKKGIHFGKHRAGMDLTGLLEQAPHGEEKILELIQVGELIPSKTPPSFHKKAFYFLAYFNLIAVFLVTLILALWRWW